MYLASFSSMHLKYGIEKPLLYRVSFRMVNLAAHFLTFLALSASAERCPSRRKEMIGLVQPFWFRIIKVWNSSMQRCLYNSTFKSNGSIPSSNDAYLATLSASEFWLHGTCMKSSWSNSWINWFINLRYFCILPSFAHILLLFSLSPV